MQQLFEDQNMTTSIWSKYGMCNLENPRKIPNLRIARQAKSVKYPTFSCSFCRGFSYIQALPLLQKMIMQVLFKRALPLQKHFPSIWLD